MWEMRAACIIVADVVVVSDICIESGRQGEGGGACADRVPIPNKLKLQHTRQIAVSLQLSVISVFWLLWASYPYTPVALVCSLDMGDTSQGRVI